MTAITTTYSFDDGGAAPVLWLQGEHDIATESLVRVALDRLAHGTAPEVVVDLSDVTFLSAWIIGLFVEASRELARQHRSLVFRSPSRSAWRLLRLCGLDRSHRILVAEPEAIPSIGHPHVTPAPTASGGMRALAIVGDDDLGPSHWYEPLAS